MTASEEINEYSIYTGLYKLLSGILIGSVHATLVTPLANYNNHVIAEGKPLQVNRAPFTLLRSFDGIVSYNISSSLRVSIGIALNSFFLHKLAQHQKTDDSFKFLSAIGSGAIAGSLATIPEAVAQTQQLSTSMLSSRQIIKDAYNHNGFLGLGRGAVATMVRSGSFTTGYLAVMPLLSQQIREQMGDHWMADVFSALVCGLIVGPLSTVPNVLRHHKQQEYNKKGAIPTYRQIVLKLGVQGLFDGIIPRTVQMMCSMFIIAEGNKISHLYDGAEFLNLSVNRRSP